MPSAELCTEDEITTLVHDFYRRVRADAVLGPVFDAHIDDWDEHLERMVRFWSSLLRRTGTYSGTPMPRHVALPDLRGDMFVRWLDLFRQTTDGFDNRPFAEQANEFAHRVARSLWYGYQISHTPDRPPTEFDHVPTDAS
ncbi:group III truncated hemoglobin [Castellaniella sp. S9]|uniref:group III truncated hemoglobin n=1 Tax=Castellaniella sp. S9 TaxID=2993652 RepID=UPI0022B379F0|nr:group III truncated hemoglobin [Castellaniella sp. S9]